MPTVVLQCGVDAKVQLDYWWERVTPVTSADPGLCTATQPAQLESESNSVSALASTLQKLLSVANLDKLRTKVRKCSML